MKWQSTTPTSKNMQIEKICTWESDETSMDQILRKQCDRTVLIGMHNTCNKVA